MAQTIGSIFVNIEKIHYVNTIDIKYEHKHLAEMEAKTDEMMALPKLFPFEFYQLYDHIFLFSIEVVKTPVIYT